MLKISAVIVQPNPESLARAVDCLKSGQCIGFPTETVYGLAADGLNPEAVTRIFEIKQRPSFDPLILHLGDPDRLDEVVSEISPAARKLAEAFWPGALTLILPRQDSVPDVVTSGLETVAARCPEHPVAREVLQCFGGPLAAPSANRFGRISPTTPQAVEAELGDAVALILDGGPCQRGLESTIVDCTESSPRIARQGAISQEEIEEVVGPVETMRQDGPPTAPGMLKSHYAPRTVLYLSDSPYHPEMAARPGHGYLLLQLHGPPVRDVLELSSTGSLPEAGRRLFSLMREADARGYRSIIAFPVPDQGLGRAINDRLCKASSGIVSWKNGEWRIG